MIGAELAIPIIYIIAAMVTISILLFQFNSRIGRVRTIRVIDSGKVCTPSVGELPSITDRKCGDVQCYQPDPDVDLVFRIGTNPVYYKSICSRLCQEVSVNGGCVNETDTFSKCISLLEPPEGCSSSANPLGRLEGTNQIYYAEDVIRT